MMAIVQQETQHNVLQVVVVLVTTMEITMTNKIHTEFAHQFRIAILNNVIMETIVQHKLYLDQDYLLKQQQLRMN